MTAIEIACRACASQPGVQCQYGTLADPEYRAPFHPERVLDAAGFGEPGGIVITDAAMHRAAQAVVDELF